MTVSPDNRRRALVLGEDPRMTLPIVRSLGRRGVQVDAGWLPQDSPVRRSRYLRQVHALPDYRAGMCAVTALRDLISRGAYQLVLPVGEGVVCLLQQHRSELEDIGSIWLLDPATFQNASDKSYMHVLASRLGIAVPPTVVVSSRDEIEDAINGAEPPIVIKTTHSTTRPDACKHFVDVHATRPTALQAAVAHLSLGRTVLVQSCLPGHGVGVEFLAWEGQILTAFQHSRLHETTGHGSTYRVGQKLDARLLDATAALVQELRYTGVGMCEFRVDEASDSWAFLEMNPRFWGSLPLAVGSGADFPWYLYQMLVDGVRRFPHAFTIGRRYRDLRSDVRWMHRAWRGGSEPDSRYRDQAEGWGINSRRRVELLGDLLRFGLFRDHIDTFAWDDPAPLFCELWSMLRHYSNLPRLQRHVRRRAIQTAGP